MVARVLKVLFRPVRLLALCAVVGVLLTPGQRANAQQITTQAGPATQVDLVETARFMDMQSSYNRSLYLFLRANPTLMDNAEFFVSFVSFLISEELEGNCSNAFSNEFERRDFFSKSFDLKPQLLQAIAAQQILQRYEVSYTVATGRYDFTSGTLPFGGIQSIGEQLSYSLRSQLGERCARQMLQGTNVNTQLFPWSFTVVDEAGKQAQPSFPFGRSLQLSDSDARVLFERFGRQLYSIVSYQMQAANDGTHRVQVIPTDAQLFGLSDNAVVRVDTYTHPALSQPNYLDISNQLTVTAPDISLVATVNFEQQGFRAVAKGQGQSKATGFSAGSSYDVTGSAAVGASTFILRLAGSGILGNTQQSGNQATTEQYLTLFGAVDFNRVTSDAAPVSGSATILSVSPDGQMNQSQPYPFTGQFVAAQQPAAEEPAAGAEAGGSDDTLSASSADGGAVADN